MLVCPLAALPRGDARRVEATPPIAVFHTEEGKLFALDDTCTHQDASLADGWVEGCEVECPLHASRFNLRTGAVDAPPAKKPVRAHPVVVEDGLVYVEVSTAEPNLPPGLSADMTTVASTFHSLETSPVAPGLGIGVGSGVVSGSNGR